MPFIKESFQISTPQRVIAFLRQILRLSMKDAQKFIDKGRVEQNGEVVRDKTLVLLGEVSVSYFKAVDLGIKPIFETPEFGAFNKPAGLLSHPKGRFWHLSLLDAVRFHFGSEANLINRLDYETSGIILASKNKKSEVELKTLFETRRVEKSYLAVVEGKLDSADFVIDLPIMEGKMGSDLGIRSKVDERGKPSQTAVKILHYDCKKNQTLLKVTPLTGRTHQIRVHLAHIGHKIIGDELYGDDKIARKFLAQKAQNLGADSANRLATMKNKDFAESSAQSRLMLHAKSLRFCYKNKEYFICVDSAPF